jgi:hypothetical protein
VWSTTTNDKEKRESSGILTLPDKGPDEVSRRTPLAYTLRLVSIATVNVL